MTLWGFPTPEGSKHAPMFILASWMWWSYLAEWEQHGLGQQYMRKQQNSPAIFPLQTATSVAVPPFPTIQWRDVFGFPYMQKGVLSLTASFHDIKQTVKDLLQACYEIPLAGSINYWVQLKHSVPLMSTNVSRMANRSDLKRVFHKLYVRAAIIHFAVLSGRKGRDTAEKRELLTVESLFLGSWYRLVDMLLSTSSCLPLLQYPVIFVNITVVSPSK